MNLMDLVATFRLDSSPAEQSVQGATSTIQKAGGMIATAAKTYIGVKAVGALVGFGKQAIQTGMQFDSAMSQVAATMGNVDDTVGKDSEAMEKLRKNAEALGVAFDETTSATELSNAVLREFAQKEGRETAFSATQAAEALNYMALAGYDANTSVDMLPTVLNLASAGAMDLAQASDMVTDTQTALGLSIEETSTMVDQMAKASSRSNTSVSQLGEAMLALGATGRNVAGGTTELSTVLGVLADNGIKGSEGGTKLRNILLSIQGKKFDKTFKQLGVEVYDASGELRALPDILGDMNKAMDGMTTAEKQNLISNTFNRGDMAAVNALLGTTTDRWGELTAAIEDSEGAAAQMAATQLNNLEGDVTLFKSAMEGLQIAISDKVTPVLRMFTKVGTDGISALTELLTNGGGLKDAFKNVLESVGFDINELSATFSYAMESIQNIAQSVIDILQGIFEVGWGIISEIWNTYGADILSFIQTTFKGVMDTIQDVMGLVSEVITISLGNIQQFWNTWGSTIMKYVGTVWNNIKAVITTTINVIRGIIKTVTSLIKGDWSGVWDGIKSIFSSVWNGIKTVVSNSIDFVKTFISDGLENAKKTVSRVLESISKTFTDIWDGVKTTVSNAIEKIKGFLNFKWELPKLKMPHFSVSGSINPIDWLTKGVPSFNVDWYRKAYDKAIMFTRPTVIPTAEGFKGFGDGSGAEVVIGASKLQELLSGARGDVIQNLTINAPQQLDASEVARKTKNANREMILALNGVR